VFSDCEFPIKELKLQRYNNLLDDSWHIFIAHEQKRLFRSFRYSIWPHHSLRRSRFHTR